MIKQRYVSLFLLLFLYFFLGYPLKAYPQQITLTIGDGSGEPGGCGTPVEVSISNLGEKIKGVTMDICDTGNPLVRLGCDNTSRTPEFTGGNPDFRCLTNELPDGCVRVLLFSEQATLIDEGTGPVFALNYGVLEEAGPKGSCRELTADNVAIAGENGPIGNVIVASGQYCFFECTLDAECNNGDFCDGIEACVGGTCQTGVNPCPDDGLFCSGVEGCDETNDICTFSGDPCTPFVCDEVNDVCQCAFDSDCDDGIFCNGDETCGGGICQPGTAPCALPLTCDETSSLCVECINDIDCDDGVFCNGAEICAGGFCQPGSLACPPLAICDEVTHECLCSVDADCDDGLFCNGVETCGSFSGTCDLTFSYFDDYPCSDCITNGYDCDCDEGNDVCQPVTLTVDNVVGLPGSTGNPATVSLDNQFLRARLINMELCGDAGDYLACTGCDPTARASGIPCQAIENNDCCNIILGSLFSEQAIEVGTGPIFTVSYDVSPLAPPPECRPLTPLNTSVANEFNLPMDVSVVPGDFCFSASAAASFDTSSSTQEPTTHTTFSTASTCTNCAECVDATEKVTIDVANVVTTPRTDTVRVPLGLTNLDNPVKGISTDICGCDGIEDNVVCTGCIVDPERAMLFNCSTSENPDGCCSVVLFTTNPEEMIPPGSGAVADILYSKTGDIDECVCLEPVNSVVSNQFNEDMCTCSSDGDLCFEVCGDIFPQDCIGGECGDTGCGDGQVNLFDILEAVDIILGVQTATDCQKEHGDIPNGVPPYCGNPAGDPNCERDGDLDILDLLVIIDKVLLKDTCCDYCTTKVGFFVDEICDDDLDNDCDGLIDCDDPDCDGDPSCEVCVPEPEVCDDQRDNDCDGLIDCDDPDCDGDPVCEVCVPEPEVCDDQRDNDCDGLIDCDDPDCDGDPVCEVCVPEPEVCDDDLDNDCDGLIDCDDPDCDGDPVCEVCVPEPEVCDDDLDNDCDGLIDCDDPDCDGDPVCEVCVPEPEVCDDDLDNDCDGLIDCDDPDCDGDPVCEVCVPEPEICDDDLDNDCDGLIDCDDPDCDGDPVCEVCVPEPEICDDDLDNDCDGLIDCDDPDCDGDPVCEVCVPEPEICDDDLDNDCDGLIDCDDPDCDGDPVCEVCVPEPEVCDDDLDNDCDGLIDCDDPDCDGDPSCLPPGDKIVYVDIKPASCPNPINIKDTGVQSVAVLGTEEFDVTTVDPGTVRLSREGVADEVSPLRWDYEDVGTPFEGELCDCHDLNGDGYLDLTLKFETQELVSVLKLYEVIEQTIPLTLTGNLTEAAGGAAISGEDCVRVLGKCKGNFDCDGDVDGADAFKLTVDFGRSSLSNPCTGEHTCNGDFDCDNDVDGSDAYKLKLHFGRSEFSDPCNFCAEENVCVYP